MASLVLPVVIFAHVGGIQTEADFQAPTSVGDVVDQAALVSWRDDNLDPTGRFEFYYQPHNVPIGASPTSGDLVGTLIPCQGLGCDPDVPEAVRILDPTDSFTWDTSSVPAGTYVIYAITHDPPLGPVFSVSPGAFTVRHPGDPLHPAAQFTDPGVTSQVVSRDVALRFAAAGEGPMTARVSWRARNGPPIYQELAADVPMRADPGKPGRFDGCVVWDLSALPNDWYYVAVEVTDAAGRTHLAYARSAVTAYRDAQTPDAGVAASCEDPAPRPDAGPVKADAGVVPATDGDGGCTCRASGRSGGAPRPGRLALFIGLAALAALASGALGRRPWRF
jgi:hypothetical protein